MNDKVPQALKDKQETIRQNTVNTVLRAIHEMQLQGYTIKIKDLIEYTGLSRSTFGKHHVREILVRSGIVEAKVLASEDTDTASKESPSVAKRLRSELKRKAEQITKSRNENAELKQECELLRGRLFLLMQHQNF